MPALKGYDEVDQGPIDIAFFYSDPLVDKKDSWPPKAVSAPNL